MKFTGVVKSLDKQGRVIIPIEMLRGLNLKSGDTVEVHGGQDPQGNPAIILKKYFAGCILCGAPLYDRKFEEANHKKICLDCIAEIRGH